MFSSIYVTVSSEAEGKEIAKKLLEQRLIACANLFPISSLYYWENKLQEDSEFAIIMKTRSKLIDQLIAELKKIHSYDIPCIVSWPIEKGNGEYLSWVERETMELKTED
jgi:periplasmic divalent cation tolerance protein